LILQAIVIYQEAMLKKKHPPMILPADVKSKEKVLHAVNDALKDIWVELTRIDRRLKALKKTIDEEAWSGE
jgi:hypothetical protein